MAPFGPDALQVVCWIGEAYDILFPPGIQSPSQYVRCRAIRVADIATIIRFESAGDPNAINRQDSNAREGHPSQGLMQLIPSTFEAYAPNPSKGILDPVQNIAAGMRYILARYGASWNVPGVVAVREGRPYVGY